MHTPHHQPAPAYTGDAHRGQPPDSSFPTSAAHDAATQTPTDRDRLFVSMLRGFRSTGGLLRGDEAADMLGFHQGLESSRASVARLGRQIAAREVVSFEWRGERWLPLFQFDPADMTLREPVRGVTAELAPVMDGWAMALWLSQPNPWLGQRAPVEAIKAGDVEAVRHAARAERFRHAG